METQRNGSERSGAGSHASLLVIFLTLVIDLIGFGIVMPFLPNLAHRFGASELVSQMIVASFSLMQFVFVPIWGRLSDRIGRRPVILVSLVGSFGSYLLFGLSDSVEILFVSRIFAG